MVAKSEKAKNQSIFKKWGSEREREKERERERVSVFLILLLQVINPDEKDEQLNLSFRVLITIQERNQQMCLRVKTKIYGKQKI